jgi:hypothetical protein
VAVSGFDPQAALTVRNAADLLNAAARRQQALLSQLEAEASRCHLQPALEHAAASLERRGATLELSDESKPEEAARVAIGRIASSVGVDNLQIAALLSRSEALLNGLAQKAAA